MFFLGVHINRRVDFLRRYNITEPVTGGLIAAVFSLVVYSTTDIETVYQLDARDTLLVYFFTGIGLNARISDLVIRRKAIADNAGTDA